MTTVADRDNNGNFMLEAKQDSLWHHLPIMEPGIKQIRLRNLLRLLSEYGEGNKSELARKCGLVPSHVSQMTTQARPVGNIAARRIEKSLNLAAGWMDVEHGGGQPPEDEEARRINAIRRIYDAQRARPEQEFYDVVKSASEEALDEYVFLFGGAYGWGEDDVLQRELLSSVFGSVRLDIYAPQAKTGLVSVAVPTLNRGYVGKVMDTLIAKSLKAKDAVRDLRLFLLVTVHLDAQAQDAQHYKAFEFLVARGIYDAVHIRFEADGSLCQPPEDVQTRLPDVIKPLPI